MKTIEARLMCAEWSDRVACGQGSHEVVFVATPWKGVEVKLNPCDLLSDLLLDLSGSTCQRAVQHSCRSGEFLQFAWFPNVAPSRPGLHPELQALTERVVHQRREMAAAIFESHRVTYPISALASDLDQLVWAGLVWCVESPPSIVPAELLLVAESANSLLRAGAIVALCHHDDPRAVHQICDAISASQLDLELRRYVLRQTIARVQPTHIAPLVRALGLPHTQALWEELKQALTVAMSGGTSASAPQRLEAVRNALRAVSSDNRDALVKLFSEIGESVLSELHQVVEDSSDDLTQLAVEVLVSIGSPASQHVFMIAYRRFPEVRSDVIDAMLTLLNSWQRSSVLELGFLLDALHVEDPDVQFLAVECLGRTENPQVLGPLLQVGKDISRSNTVRRQVAYSLAATGLAEATEILARWFADADAAVRAAIADSVMTLSERLPISAARDRCLRWMLATTVEPLVLRALRLLELSQALTWQDAISLCRAKDDSIVQRAAAFLADHGNLQALPVLLDILQQRPVVGVVHCEKAALELARQIDPDDPQQRGQIRALLRTQSVVLKTAAVELLSRWSDPRAVEILLSVGINASEKGVASLVGRQLASRKVGRAQVPKLVKLLAEGDDRVARNVAQILGCLGPEVVPAVAAALKWKLVRARRLAAQILETVGDRTCLNALDFAGGDSDAHVAAAATSAAKAIRARHKM